MRSAAAPPTPVHARKGVREMAAERYACRKHCAATPRRMRVIRCMSMELHVRSVVHTASHTEPPHAHSSDYGHAGCLIAPQRNSAETRSGGMTPSESVAVFGSRAQLRLEPECLCASAAALNAAARRTSSAPRRLCASAAALSAAARRTLQLGAEARRSARVAERRTNSAARRLERRSARRRSADAAPRG